MGQVQAARTFSTFSSQIPSSLGAPLQDVMVWDEGWRRADEIALMLGKEIKKKQKKRDGLATAATCNRGQKQQMPEQAIPSRWRGERSNRDSWSGMIVAGTGMTLPDNAGSVFLPWGKWRVSYCLFCFCPRAWTCGRVKLSFPVKGGQARAVQRRWVQVDVPEGSLSLMDRLIPHWFSDWLACWIN